MNTTQLMNKTLPLQEQLPYIMSGVVDIYKERVQTIGIVLVHDCNDSDIDLETSIHEYLSFGVQKLYLVNSDGSKIPEEICYKFPNLVSMSFGEKDEVKDKVLSLGYVLNTAFDEINTDIVFLSWTSINPFGMSSRLLNHKMEDFPLCVMPVFENEVGEMLSTSFYPKKKISGVKIILRRNNPLYTYSLFPFMGVGIYNREKFMRIGGFDINITDLEGQLLEFGVRAYANNMKVRLSPYYRVQLNVEKNEVEYRFGSRINDLICIKAGIGIKLVHMAKYMVKNLNSIRTARGILKLFSDKNVMYKHQMHENIKEYWSV